jgi:hypothetical protein
MDAMKQFQIAFGIFLLIVVGFAACKKSSSAAKTNTELITQSSWKFDKATVGGFDASQFLQTCQTDNIITFSTGGTGTVDEGPTKCNAGDPQTDAFNWNFVNNDSLHISTVLFAGGGTDFKIVTLSDTQLVGSQDITIAPGNVQTVVATFIH